MADDEDLDIGMNGMLLEKIVNFCYVGDILDADGGCDSAVIIWVKRASKKTLLLTYINWKMVFIKE